MALHVHSRKSKRISLTDDLGDRLIRHNRGEISSTAKYRPWQIVNFTAFPTREQAAAYEKYLKSGSGTTFRHKHLAPKKKISSNNLRRLRRLGLQTSHLSEDDGLGGAL